MYVNEKWLNDPKNKIPDEYSSWGGFVKLLDDGLKKQINIVKNIDELNSSDEEKKLIAIWKASNDIFNKWENNSGNFEEINNEFIILDNHFKNEEHIKNIANYLYYCKMNGISNLIDFDTGSDLKNVEKIVLDICIGGLSLPQEYYKSDSYKDKLELFKKHLISVKEIIDNGSSIKLSDDFVENIISFENKIAECTMKPEQSRQYDKYYTNTTLENLYLEINKLNSLDAKQDNYTDDKKNYILNDDMKIKAGLFFEQIYDNFNFRKILKNNYNKNFITQENDEIYHITAFDGDGLRNILRIIFDISNKTEYISYLQYNIIKCNSMYCTKNLNDEFFDFYQRKLNGQKKQKNYEKRSINTINSLAGEILGKLFVKKYFSENSKLEINRLVKNIISTMNISIKENDWLTKETKNKAIKKLSSFTTKLGYPDEWKDFTQLDINIGNNLPLISKKVLKWDLNFNFFDKINSVLDRKEWKMNPQTVNAYFMPTQNEIVFPAAILQPPFFYTDIKDIDFDITQEMENIRESDILLACNYGGIGAVIAHEITHGYDDQGRNFDADGNLNNWWCEEDSKLFKEKTEIMAKCAKDYVYIVDNNEYKMNSELTMGENLADLGGLSLSLKSLLNELRNNKKTEMEIKKIIRIFFKSWANIWKQNINKEKRIMLLNIDPHAPTDFRGNLVKHIDLFYEVFDVKEEDKMFIPFNERTKMW